MKRNEFIDGIRSLVGQMSAANLRETEYPTIVLEFPDVRSRMQFEKRLRMDIDPGTALAHEMMGRDKNDGVFAVIDGVKVKMAHWGPVRGLVT